MKTYRWALAGLVAVAACGGSDRENDVAVSDTLTRELEIAPADTFAPIPLPDERAASGQEQRSRAGARPARPRPKRAASPTSRKSVRAATTPPPAAPSASPAAEPAETLSGSARSSDSSTDHRTDAEASNVPGPGGGADTTPARTTPADTARKDTARSVIAPADTSVPTDSASATAPVPAPPSPVPAAPRADSARPAASGATAHMLPVGTEIRALLEDSIHSLRNSEGQRVTARVADDLRAPDGSVLVPSGSTVRLTIARLRPARSRSAADGELELHADSLVVANDPFAVSADVRPIPHELRGRGVTAGEVEKEAAGAAEGAAAGGVITGKTKGAVIGGVVGAAGGAAVAVQTASRDVVVAPKTVVVLVLTAPWGGGQR